MTQVKIASWNVNSVNARIENLLFWLREAKPDIALLQEIKCEDANFPALMIADLGYQIVTHGQKSYNGVAILSKFPMQDIVRNIDATDTQSRYIEATVMVPCSPCLGGASLRQQKMGVCKIRVASIYIPNGGAELLPNQKLHETDKFIYKIKFFDDLKNHLRNLLKYNEIAVFGGDYNVALNDIDVYDPKGMKNTVCFHEDEQRKMREILNLGYHDSFRMMHPNVQNFSWWDYRGNSWKFNKGMRIDYVLTSPKASDFLKSAFMDDKMMMEREKPSDHCPVNIILDLDGTN